jgi:RimJ/RimL family protein N-acetyltransferase
LENLIINIETNRLLLRNLKTSDVSQEYVKWLNDPEINKYLGCANTIQTIESCLAYVHGYEGRNDVALIGMFNKSDDLHIGNITLSFIDWHNKAVAVGISIGRKKYISKGIGRESLRATVQYCFHNLGLHRITSGINVNNLRSLNMFVNCGFKIEGLLRGSNIINSKFEDSYLLSVLESDLLP